ncbi:hypothetical protein C0Q70_02512 [Pomacea canaliculata]|uniref:PARP catalytic domain-containing protein n=1 Tax=Pomacea canaliculata TaxID=400727 RepID=A0A2T7PQ50_POMCA|nr:hypothetical protein C0Q70_02512 [Pomacea canaliculata]
MDNGAESIQTGHNPSRSKARRGGGAPVVSRNPTLQAARGICSNSFDFPQVWRKCGSSMGQGSLLLHQSQVQSQLHTCSHHSYRRPLRFMFLGRILVGQYTLGNPSYTKPPERDRLKLYDSCVNNVSNPTIFVIFDLAQSYPEYLIQYTDVQTADHSHSSAHQRHHHCQWRP